VDPLLISVVIPCRNDAAHVGDAIRSALGQTYPRREVVVVDDGSTDGSIDVIKSFGDAVRWETGANHGGCAARNRGLALAHGELIQFLDADDVLGPEKLSRQAPEARRHPDALTYCDYEWRDLATGKALGVHSRDCCGYDPVEFVLRTQRLQTSAPLHWKFRLEQAGGFREGLPCAQEYDLHLRLACRGVRFVHVPEVLYAVRVRAGSVSSDSVRVLDQHAGICGEACRLLRERGALNDKRLAAFAALLASDARAYLRHGEPERAARYFELARQQHPGAGLRAAYSPATLRLRRILGPGWTERLVGLKRRLVRPTVAG
jgi:glycosyltransferase involved in cell wall biosynthesis